MDEIQAKKEAGVGADSIPNIFGVAEDTVPHAYIPMLIPGNQWTELIVINPMNPYTSSSYNIVIELGNDTIIEGVKYTQMIEYSNRVLPSLGDTSVYISYIREDTTTQKVFYLYGEEEELLYDFQLQVGDSVDYSYYRERVEKVDFVEIGGILRKRITLAYDTANYIEGIGCLDGGLVSGLRGYGAGSRTTLVSFSQNGVQVYPKAATGIPQISLSRRK
ncbi:hypothetical protein AGMMS49525_02330 [Bacteroidia bacterium]|nr:hypothetical protein AGMMS49525_02330 [Bacteroidia bacterium]